MIPKHIQEQIEKDAEAYSQQKEADYSQRSVNAYRAGAESYASKLLAAEELIERMAESINDLLAIAYPNIPTLKKANQVLDNYATYKQKKNDATHTS